MQFETHDLIGSLGASLILGTYFLLQVNRISARSMLYSQLNALGAAMILTSLWFDFNWSAFMIESAWLVISIVGALVTLVNREPPGGQMDNAGDL